MLIGYPINLLLNFKHFWEFLVKIKISVSSVFKLIIMRIKKSFKLNISDSDILNNFNITLTNNVVRRSAFLWNQYQIYLYDLQNSENVARALIFSFDTVAQIIASYHYLICRDQDGIVWKAIMKYSNLSLTEITPHFDKLEENVISLAHTEDGKLLLCLKVESNSCNLSVYNLIHSTCLNRFVIANNDIIYNETNDKCKMYCRLMNEKILLVIITFNGFILHYFSVDINQTSNKCIIAKKLINCPTEINDIHFTNENILISLTIGTIIKIEFDLLKHSKLEPQIIHLNTAIQKILLVNDYLIYTDGQTMWRADNIYSKEDINFRQIFVKLVKDFVCFDPQNEILCTSYMKALYRFSLDDETVYIKPVSNTEYCNAKLLLDNMSYMHNIVSEIEENNEITRKIKMEESLITTIALANRQDIVNDIIHIENVVYENYENIVHNYKLLTLTNDIKDYYTLDTYYLLIKMTVTPVHPKFTDILSDLFGKLEIHITILTDNKVLKTVTVKVIKQLASMNIVVPLTYLKNTKITVYVKLVTSIPGSLDKKQTLWVTLHKSETVLSSEHFIKTILPSSNICHLKKNTETIDNLICENATKHYGNLFKFSKMNNKTNSMKWQLYVKLPKNYKELFGNENLYQNLNSSQIKLLMSVMSGDNFINNGNSILLNVANEKVEIDIDTGFSNPILRTACVNLQVASDIRDFISNLLHSDINNSKEEFVSNSIFKTLEDLENDIIMTADSNEKILELHDKFQKHIIIALNI